MRTLLLMRHASAEGWSSEGDKGRPLSPLGHQEAAAAGAELQALGVQQVLCSSARRTRETLAGLGLGAPVEFMDALYNCGTATLAQRIGEVDDEVGCLLVVGHAPAIPSLAAELAWAQNPEAADELQCWFPTASFARFTLQGRWADVVGDQTLCLAQVRRLG